MRHLPSDSAFARSREGEAAEWSTSDHLLAAAVDHLAIANWMYASVNRDEDAEALDPPLPVPRPGATAEPPPTDAPTAADLARFFG